MMNKTKGEFPECGCHYTVDDDGIHFCPMHKAAPDLLSFIQELVDGAESEKQSPDNLLERAKALIAKATGGK